MSFFPKKTLLATDGSEDSALALQAAVDLAARTGSELHVVHVGLISAWVQPDAMSPSQLERLREEARKVLGGQVEQVRAAGGEIEEAHLRMGRTHSEVIQLSEEIEAGLIVIGSRGQNTIQRLLLGSDAESIVRHAPCPVMVVRREDHVRERSD